MARTDDYAALYAAFINLQRDIDVRLSINEEMKKSIKNENDVTRKKGLEDKLQRSEARLEKLLEKYNDTKKKIERKEMKMKPGEIQEGRTRGKLLVSGENKEKKSEKNFLVADKREETQPAKKGPLAKDFLKEKKYRELEEGNLASKLADARERLHIAEDQHKNALNDRANMVNVRTKA